MKNNSVPTHMAFIMDGNRRWAKRKGLPTLKGHYKGYQRIVPLVEYAQKCGIKYITFWAFSTENWNRSKKEVDYLMDLFRKLFKSKLVKKLIDKGGRINIFGSLYPFPEDIQKSLKKIITDSKDNTKIVINIGLNYGGRDEIIYAVKGIMEDKLRPSQITKEIFAEYLYTKSQPDPDMIIRTGGTHRLSGFLPWQGVYSELYFTKIFWPEFDEKEFDKALKAYSSRERRFGK